MRDDFDDLLRRSLVTRAREVTPHPETWNRVQRRIRRDRTIRFGSAGFAAAAIAAVAVIAVPTLVDDGAEIRFPDEVADAPVIVDVPTASPSTPEPEPAPDFAGGTVVTDGLSIDVFEADGEQALDLIAFDASADVLISDVAVRPGSTTTELDVIYRTGVGCETSLSYASAGGPIVGGEYSDLGALGPDPTGCPKPAVWSSDGRNAAWVEGDPDAGYVLRVVEVTQERNDLGTLFNDVGAVPLEISGVAGLEVVDWLGGSDGGILRFLGEANDGRVVRGVESIGRDQDGVWATTGQEGVQRLAQYDATTVLAWHDSHVDPASPGPAYTVDADFDSAADRASNPRLVVSGDGDLLEAVPLPDEVISQDKVDGGDLWLTAYGERVIIGDGYGRAWTAVFDFDAGTWSEIQRVDGEVRHASLLRPAAAGGQPTAPAQPSTPAPTEPTAAPTGEPSETVSPEPPPVEDEGPGTDTEIGATAAAAATRDAVIAAARAEDWDALRGLMAEGFSSGFGGQEDHIAYYQANEGSLATLVAAMELPAGRDASGNIVWPFAHARDLRSLSSAEIESLAPLASAEQIEQWAEAGSGWLGPRAGITPDGAWIFYILGGD